MRATIGPVGVTNSVPERVHAHRRTTQELNGHDMTSASTTPTINPVTFEADIDEAVQQADGAFTELHTGAETALAALHLKKRSTFALGSSGVEITCLVVRGEGFLTPVSDEDQDEEDDYEDDAEDDQDFDDDEVEDDDGLDSHHKHDRHNQHDRQNQHDKQSSSSQRSDVSLSRTRLREGRLVVISGPMVVHTKRHGLRLLIVSRVNHTLLPAVQ